MSWCRLESNYRWHPKTLALCARLADAEADRYLPRLWAWASACCSSGVLPELVARDAIESACSWRGIPGVLFKSLVECGLVDIIQGQALIHDWSVVNGYHLKEQRRKSEAKWLNSETPRAEPRTNPRAEPLVSPRGTDGRTDVTATTTVPTERVADKDPPLRRELVIVPDDKPAKRARKPKPAPSEPVEPKTPQAALVETWSAVYLAQTGKTYRYSAADFIQGSQLVRQGVTPDELRGVATRAFRAGISPYLAVRSFKQLVAKYPEVATARVLDSLHNVGTDEEFQEQARREQQEALPSWITKPSTN